MIDGVDLTCHVHLAVAVGQFVRKAAAVLVDPDVARALDRSADVRRVAGITDVETRGVGVHVPELRAHGLRQTQTVAGVAGIAERANAGAHREVHEAFLVEFEAARLSDRPLPSRHLLSINCTR